MTVKTAMSRFQIHDELTVPEGSRPIVKTILSTGGSMSKFLAVLAGSPSSLRAYARMRSELRAGALSPATRARIALAVAEMRGDNYGIDQHVRVARAAGLGIDEIARARDFESSDAREAALLHYLKASIEDGRPPVYLHEEAREAGWEDDQILEGLANLALADFESLIANAADLPLDQPRAAALPSAA